MQRSNRQDNFEEQDGREFTLPNIKTFYKLILIQTGVFMQEQTKDQQNREEREINPQ